MPLWGLSKEEAKRLKELQFEYNRRRSNMLEIIEAQMNNEDMVLRKLLNDSPSYPDYDDPTIIAYDKNGKGYSANQLRDKDDNT